MSRAVLFLGSLYLCFHLVCVSNLKSECYIRDYGHGSGVCVCNETHCDSLATIHAPDEGFVTVSTTKAGQRWKISYQNFSHHDNNIPWLGKRQVLLVGDANGQEFLGFGGAFTDATGVNVFSLPSDMRNQILSSYYGDEGLEYTLGRVPIGGTDFSTHPYTYDDFPEDKSLKRFALQMEDIKYKIPMILESLKMSEAGGRHVKLFASPWSAPAWMKSNNNIKGKGKLLHKYYGTWAQYLVRFLKEYSKHNVSFWGMTLQNEPTDGLLSHFSFNCMGWTPEDQAKWLGKYLGPTLEQEGFAHTKLFILDDNRFFLPKWVDIMMSYPSAAQYVYGVAVHWYTDAFTPAALLDVTHKKHPQLPLLYTEACNGQWPWQILKVVLGSWVRAESYASNIIENLNHWATGWTDWNMALDLEGGPNWAGNFVDSPIIVNKTSNEFYRQPTFYILAHFSKILPLGSVRMDVSVIAEENEGLVDHVVFKRPDNAIAVILLNKHGVDRHVWISDMKGHQLDLTIVAHSIMSILWQ
ncbi:lysosomal acid glucosylceramidase-like [Oratosquilla oratoria]|uniref:lysosomal acid glucosylceramidase-like n=1 Tax=Oratosquilla oratoria TaxID=337810 RepID=UPI003F766090